MSREDLHFRLRIPEDLKKRVEISAEKNRRSMTAEIVSRLQNTFDLDDALNSRAGDLGQAHDDLAKSVMQLTVRLQDFQAHLQKIATTDPSADHSNKNR